MESTEQVIRHYIVKTLGRDAGHVAPEESLLEAGVLDSLGVLSLVEFVGERFGIRVSEDDMVPENFDSLRAVAAFVERRRGESSR